MCLLPLLLLLLLAAPAGAWAHATLLGSVPPAGAVLDSGPGELVLAFDEPVTPLELALREADGGPVAIGEAAAAGNEVRLALPAALPRGRYLASWRVTSLDGHVIAGSFAFAVGVDLLPPAAHQAGDAWRWPGLALHLAARLALLLAAGSALFLLLVAGRDWPRLDRFARRAAASALLLGLAGLFLGGLRFSGQSPWSPDLGALWGALRQAPGLAAWLGGLAALALLALPLPAPLRLLAALAAPVSLAGSGHALPVWPQLGAALMWLHGLAAAGWVGALLPLRWALALPGAAPWPLYRRFQGLGLAAVLLVLASGLALAWAILDDWSLLWRTDYGLILLAKLALVGVMLAIALANRLSLTRRALASDRGRRRLVRVLRLDAFVALLVVALATGLSLGPPKPAATPVILALENDAWHATVTVTPGGVGDSAIHLEIRDLTGAPARLAGARLTLSAPAATIGPLTQTLRSEGDAGWRAAGLPLWHPGPWTLRLDLLVDSFTSRRLEGTFELTR